MDSWVPSDSVGVNLIIFVQRRISSTIKMCQKLRLSTSPPVTRTSLCGRGCGCTGLPVKSNITQRLETECTLGECLRLVRRASSVGTTRSSGRSYYWPKWPVVTSETLLWNQSWRIAENLTSILMSNLRLKGYYMLMNGRRWGTRPTPHFCAQWLPNTLQARVTKILINKILKLKTILTWPFAISIVYLTIC